MSSEIKSNATNSVDGPDKRLNVVVLSVDTLRADRTSLYGYERPTTPALEKIAKDSIVCENTFTLAPFTQCACIQIFTSSRPLMHGGYDNGAHNRPENIFARFKAEGYKTTGMSTVHWVSPYYGYTNGLDAEYQLFFLDTLVGMAVGTMADTLSLYRLGKIDANEMTLKVIPNCYRLFDNLENYADQFTDKFTEYKAKFPDSKVVNSGYNFKKVKRIVSKHRNMMYTDPLSYINYYLPSMIDTETWLTRDWRYARTIKTLIGELGNRLINKAIGLVNKPLERMRNNRFKLSADARSLADNVISSIKDHDADSPFFIWAHFKDTHHPYVSGHGRKWYTHTRKFLQNLGYDPNYDPALPFNGKKPRSDEEMKVYSALYDAAVASTDQEVGRIVDAIDELGLGENTVVVFCADHGEEIGDHNDQGHTCALYEHNVKVPLLFRRLGMKSERNQSLVTLLDMAPTLTHLAGIDAASGWEGKNIAEGGVSDRSHVILETFCRGNCIFDHRPFYVAVRTYKYKYIWKEYRDKRDKVGPDGPELYDLESDPKELVNLYQPDHPEVADFNRMIANRLAEIDDVTDDRIDKAFGPGWRNKETTA